MAKHEVNTQWLNNMSFESEVNGHKILLDAAEEFGGQNKGPSPKPLLLTSFAGCTGIDVVSLLKKMRADFSDFNLKVTAELTNEHPKVYNRIHLVYQIKIAEMEREKMEKAVKLSQEQLCGVSTMLKKVCEVSWEIEYL